MAGMTEPPTPPPGGVPTPGEQRPAGRLARPPSERYGRADAPLGLAPSARTFGGRVRALTPAVAVGIATAALLALVGGVLAEFRGLLGISGLGGAIVGLVAARAAVPTDARPALLTRSQAVNGAMLIGALTIVAGALATWAYGRLEGGVLDPVTYLWATFGPLVFAQLGLAVVGAAWGARSGPIRGT